MKRYRPGGGNIKAFHESDKFFRMIAGPIGSGKTTFAGVAETVFTAMLQKPHADGVRRAKVGVLRDTYRNLYATFIPTWFRWIPRELGHFVGSDDRPAVHTFTLDSPVGPCELQVEMRAHGPNTVEHVTRGWELSGCYLDEVDLMPREALSFLAGRVQRFPDAQHIVSRGVWASFNKPDVDHWLYDLCVEDRPANLAYFDQPGGLLPGGPPFRTNPEAENLSNLPEGYYEISAQGQPEWYIRRMLRNQWGASVSGEPIYPEFREALHMSPVELEPDRRQELVLGVDGGGTPAAVIGGRDRFGRRVIYGEVVLADPYDPKGRKLSTGVGPKRFADAVRDALHPRFASNPVTVAYADPAMFYGADREMGEYADIETIGQMLQIPVTPAPSNEVALRHEAVRGLMTTLGPDGSPNLIVNPSCKWLRRGFASDYKWQERDPKQPGARLKAQKSATSHVHDALQYFALGDQGRAAVTAGPKFDRHRPKDRTDWSPFRDAAPALPGQSYGHDFDLWRS